MKHIGVDCHKQYDRATVIDIDTGEIKVTRLAYIKEEIFTTNDMIQEMYKKARDA